MAGCWLLLLQAEDAKDLLDFIKDELVRDTRAALGRIRKVSARPQTGRQARSIGTLQSGRVVGHRAGGAWMLRWYVMLCACRGGGGQMFDVKEQRRERLTASERLALEQVEEEEKLATLQAKGAAIAKYGWPRGVRT